MSQAVAISHFLVGLLAVGLSHAVAETPNQVDWTQQLGTTAADYSESVAVDGAGNVLISGYTWGDLDGNINAGKADAFLTKYDAAGTKLWTRQIGTSHSDPSYSVAVDGAGNAYISGYTTGEIDGQVNAGGEDAFLTKYDATGTKLWTRQLGSAAFETSYSVAVDGVGNAYISGYTTGDLDGHTSAGGVDAFLTKYDATGTKLWTQQIGTSTYETSYAVAVDGSGNAFISGLTTGDLDGNTGAGGGDAFLTKYDASGSKLWTQQLGTASADYSWSVAVDGAGNVYISGTTESGLDGNPHAGGVDAFITKYDGSGTKLWTEQIGTTFSDLSYSVSVDSVGNAYISGYTWGDMDGNVSAGGIDAFLTKYDTTGAKLWTQQIGTADEDRSYAVAVDWLGNAYLSGSTMGSFAGHTNAGDADAFLVRLAWQGLLGDLDGDGDVDNLDIGTATGNFTGAGGSTSMTYADGDIDGDGDVDNVDLGTITGAFTGSLVPEPPLWDAPELPSVPEPASMMLLGMGGVALCRRRASPVPDRRGV
jgi:hypothetical protein